MEKASGEKIRSTSSSWAIRHVIFAEPRDDLGGRRNNTLRKKGVLRGKAFFQEIPHVSARWPGDTSNRKDQKKCWD